MVLIKMSGGPTSAAIRCIKGPDTAGSAASATSRMIRSGRSLSPASLRSTPTIVSPAALSLTATA
jgi:hypothetical protein